MYKGPFLRCVDHWRAAGTQPPPSVFVEKNRNVKNSGVSFCFKERNFIGIGTIILKRRRRFFLSRGVNCLEKRNQCGFFLKSTFNAMLLSISSRPGVLNLFSTQYHNDIVRSGFLFTIGTYCFKSRSAPKEPLKAPQPISCGFRTGH
uniref:Uncharacterized protein n=1 Tax=Cacopsylla melanoneura TaxID=428564 RepID=A0A8D8TR80_9HEMI